MKIKEVFVVSKEGKSAVDGQGKIFDRGQVFFNKNDAEKIIEKDGSLSITEGFQIFGDSPLEKSLLNEEYNLQKNTVSFYYKSDEDGAKEDLAQYQVLVTNILNLKIGDIVYISVFEDGTFAGKVKYVDLIKCNIILENAIRLTYLSCGYCGDSLAKDEIILDISSMFEVDTESIREVDATTLENEFLSGSNFREARRKALAEYLNIDKSKISCKGYNVAIKEGRVPDSVEVFKFTAGGKDYIVLDPAQSEKERILENLENNCMIPQFDDWDNQNSDAVRKVIEPDWYTEITQGDYSIYEYPHAGDIEILINSKGFKEAGYGYVYSNGDYYLGCEYQNKLDLSIPIEDAIQKLSDNSKSYIPEGKNSISVINSIFDFWSVTSSQRPMDIQNFDSFNEAFNYMTNKELPFILFFLKDTKINKHKENICKWICTDEMQYVKKVSGTAFIVIETSTIPGEDKFIITKMFIDLDNYNINSKDFFNSYISGYGYASLKYIKSKYGNEGAYQVFAEIVSEMDSLSEGEKIKECSSEKEVQEFLKEYIKNN